MRYSRADSAKCSERGRGGFTWDSVHSIAGVQVGGAGARLNELCTARCAASFAAVFCLFARAFFVHECWTKEWMLRVDPVGAHAHCMYYAEPTRLLEQGAGSLRARRALHSCSVHGRVNMPRPHSVITWCAVRGWELRTAASVASTHSQVSPCSPILTLSS